MDKETYKANRAKYLEERIAGNALGSENDRSRSWERLNRDKRTKTPRYQQKQAMEELNNNLAKHREWANTPLGRGRGSKMEELNKVVRAMNKGKKVVR